MNIYDALLLTLAAIVLLGSPGPGIAALIAVGRGAGMRGGLRFYWGLQVGLALACGASAVGLFSLIGTIPSALDVLTGVATIYLLWLAFKIATAQVGDGGSTPAPGAGPSATSGFVLGITNPKSYLAFAALLASKTLIPGSVALDGLAKWSICVAVMIVVDVLWLWLGVVVGRIGFGPRAERAMNIAMAAVIVVTTLLSAAQRLAGSFPA